MARARRWTLVGDPKQLPPYVDREISHGAALTDYQLTRQQLERTILDRLLALLPDESTSSLTIQHRMAAPIGRLVSDCFYGGLLRNASNESEPSPYELVVPKRVTWMTTAGLADAEKHGSGRATPMPPKHERSATSSKGSTLSPKDSGGTSRVSSCLLPTRAVRAAGSHRGGTRPRLPDAQYRSSHRRLVPRPRSRHRDLRTRFVLLDQRLRVGALARRSAPSRGGKSPVHKLVKEDVKDSHPDCDL